MHQKIALLEGASKKELRALVGALPPMNGATTDQQPCALIYEGAACTSAFRLTLHDDQKVKAIDIYTDDATLERATRLSLPNDAVIGGGYLNAI